MKAETRREVIHVRGQADETLDVVLTRHGPIVRRDTTEKAGCLMRCGGRLWSRVGWIFLIL